MLASRLASAATKASVARPSKAFAIFVSTSSGVSNPSTVESREASALASALPMRAASRAAVVTAPRERSRSSSPPQRKCPRPSRVSGLGSRVSGLGCRVSGLGASGLGSRISGLGSRVSGLGSRVSGSRVSGLGSWVSGLGSRGLRSRVISGLGSRVSGLGSSGLGSRVSGLGSRVSGLGFRVSRVSDLGLESRARVSRMCAVLRGLASRSRDSGFGSWVLGLGYVYSAERVRMRERLAGMWRSAERAHVSGRAYHLAGVGAVLSGCR